MVEVILTRMRRSGQRLRVRGNRGRCHRGEYGSGSALEGEGIASPRSIEEKKSAKVEAVAVEDRLCSLLPEKLAIREERADLDQQGEEDVSWIERV